MKIETDESGGKITITLEPDIVKSLNTMILDIQDIVKEMDVLADKEKRKITNQAMINATKKQDNKHPDPSDADPISKNSG